MKQGKTKKAGIILFIAFFGFQVKSQQKILNDPEFLEIMKEGVNHIYNCEFKEARDIYYELEERRPNHPVVPFYYGILIYWEGYPLTLNHPLQPIFVAEMNKAIVKSAPLLERDPNDTEGVFFDLASRSMLLMHYADNGESMKILKQAPTAYKQVMKSFSLKDEFNEYYFITGLYNYYIEAYPEKHPVYKPLKIFFKSGDKELGLKELQYASEETIFIKVEASLFLALIYFNFENNVTKAIHYIELLHTQYPKNPMFHSKYVEFLLLAGEYEQADEMLTSMLKQFGRNRYITMKGAVFRGILEEKYRHNLAKAEKHYYTGIKIASEFGDRAGEYVSYAYYGLSRINKAFGNTSKSEDYKRIAQTHSSYDHFSTLQ